MYHVFNTQSATSDQIMHVSFAWIKLVDNIFNITFCKTNIWQKLSILMKRVYVNSLMLFIKEQSWRFVWNQF